MRAIESIEETLAIQASKHKFSTLSITFFLISRSIQLNSSSVNTSKKIKKNKIMKLTWDILQVDPQHVF